MREATLTVPPGYHGIRAVVAEDGVEHARDRLLDGSLLAFALDPYSGVPHPIPPVLWARLGPGDEWLNKDCDWFFSNLAQDLPRQYAVIVQIPEKPLPGKHPGGRPPDYDWEGAAIAVAAKIHTSHGITPALAVIQKYLSEWFALTDKFPGETQIKVHARKIRKAYLDEGGN
jgi:hypothetical protein